MKKYFTLTIARYQKAIQFAPELPMMASWKDEATT
jgi:hypothetical protein